MTNWNFSSLSLFLLQFSINRHKRKSKDSLPYKSSSSTGSPMDPSIVFNGYENPDAFMIRYKTLERQQQHFNVSWLYKQTINRTQLVDSWLQQTIIIYHSSPLFSIPFKTDAATKDCSLSKRISHATDTARFHMLLTRTRSVRVKW